MQNHGGYEDEYEATVHLTDMTDMPMAEQYLSLIRESDQALQYLLEYYSQIDEPTMIVLFGDHQPSIEPEFYETLYGSPISELSPEKLVERYITPFIIWTNYETDCRMDEKMSVQYFPCAILERANLELTDYMCLLDTMYQSAPVVHIFGYYNSDYEWESWTGCWIRLALPAGRCMTDLTNIWRRTAATGCSSMSAVDAACQTRTTKEGAVV